MAACRYGVNCLREPVGRAGVEVPGFRWECEIGHGRDDDGDGERVAEEECVIGVSHVCWGESRYLSCRFMALVRHRYLAQMLWQHGWCQPCIQRLSLLIPSQSCPPSSHRLQLPCCTELKHGNSTSHITTED